MLAAWHGVAWCRDVSTDRYTTQVLLECSQQPTYYVECSSCERIIAGVCNKVASWQACTTQAPCLTACNGPRQQQLARHKRCLAAMQARSHSILTQSRLCTRSLEDFEFKVKRGTGDGGGKQVR